MQYRKFLFFWQTFSHVVGPNGHLRPKAASATGRVRPRASAAGPYKFALRLRRPAPARLQHPLHPDFIRVVNNWYQCGRPDCSLVIAHLKTDCDGNGQNYYKSSVIDGGWIAL